MEAIQARAAQNRQTVAYALNDWNIQQAVEIAQRSSVAIVFAAADSGEEYITFDGNMGDRNNLSVWNNGDNLVFIFLCAEY
jgi:hypothetical protein